MLPTGKVTFLFTDIEGSTHLARHLGDRWAAVLKEHPLLLRGTWQTHRGREIRRARVVVLPGSRSARSGPARAPGGVPAIGRPTRF